MQCFGGCFAADKELGDPLGSSASNVLIKNPGATIGPKAGCKGHPCCAHGRSCRCCRKGADAADKPTLKPKLRLLSSKTSKAEDCGQTYTADTESTAADRERLRQEYLMQNGRHILGISTLQQEQLRHFVMPGIGYIAYALMSNGLEVLNKKTAVGLSEPVCDRQHFRTMAEAFIKEHPKAMWVQVSYEFASILQDHHFTCNSMGGETRLDLATYNFTGYARRGLRSAIASAVKDGLTVEEVMHPDPETFGSGAVKGAGAAAAAAVGRDWSSVAREFEEVDAAWAASKSGRANDVWFINRPPVFAPEAGVRKFVARDVSGKIQGFIFFDGVFEDGQLTGYYANVTRMLPGAHAGTLNLIMKEFIERVRGEAQLAAPAKKLSMRKSQRKKLELAAAAANGDPAAAATSRSPEATPVSTAEQQSPTQGSSSGPKFLSLGLSPFYQMNNSHFKHCQVTHLLLLLCYTDGAGFYPFKTLAAAKAKYGAGLHNFKYEDPSVEYRNAFLCHNRKGPNAAFWGMFDLAKLYGFWTDPVDCFGRYFGYKGKQGADLLVKGLKRATSLDTYKPNKAKNKKNKSFSSSSSSSSSSSRTSSTGVSGLMRAVSALAAMKSSRQGSSSGSSGGGNVAAVGGRQQGKKLQNGADAAAAGGDGDGGSCLGECNSGSGLSGEMLIATGNQPAAPSAQDSSNEPSSSSAASTGSANPGGARSSDGGVAQLASSNTNRDSSHSSSTNSRGEH